MRSAPAPDGGNELVLGHEAFENDKSNEQRELSRAMPEIHTITSDHALMGLAVPFIGRRPIPSATIELRLPSLTLGENAELQERVNALRSVCGCTAGGYACLVAMAVCVIAFGWWPLAGALNPLGKWVVGVVTVVASSASAKAAALLMARYRLNRLIGRVRIGGTRKVRSTRAGITLADPARTTKPNYGRFTT